MNRASRIRQWLPDRQPTILILLYHRVTTLESDPQLLSVTPRHFSEHLDVLRRRYRPAKLEQITFDETQRSNRQRRVAVTFDDGYADNLYQARPLLESVGWPATVFVTAGQIDIDREFWWDELERVFLRTPGLPRQLRLTIGGCERAWEIKDGEQCCDPKWNVMLGLNPMSRQAAYLELAFLLRSLQSVARQRIIEEIQCWAGLRLSGRVSHRSLSSKELRRLTADGLIEVGAHTVTHPSLPALPISAQRSEIFDSKAMVERILDKPVRTFSYPFGARSDFNARTIRLVNEAGFDVACANFSGIVCRSTHRYKLPRMLVRDWDGDEFTRQLEMAFGG